MFLFCMQLTFLHHSPSPCVTRIRFYFRANRRTFVEYHFRYGLQIHLLSFSRVLATHKVIMRQICLHTVTTETENEDESNFKTLGKYLHKKTSLNYKYTTNFAINTDKPVDFQDILKHC